MSELYIDGGSNIPVCSWKRRTSNVSEVNKTAQINYLQDLVVQYGAILGVFVKAYEASDATDFSDEMRVAYARASIVALAPRSPQENASE